MSSSPQLTKFYLREEESDGGKGDVDTTPVPPTIRALRTMPGKENSVSVDSQDSTDTTRTVSTDGNGNNRVRISRNDQVFEYRREKDKEPSSPTLSVPTTPSRVFSFPTFDELFENGGKAKLNIRRMPSFPSYLIDSNIEEEDVCVEAIGDNKPVLQRQDTLMKMTFLDMVFKSWENSKGLSGFQRRLGGHILHKYCMCCRPNVTLFLFLHVLYGITLTSIGFVCLMECREDPWIPGYLLLDGVCSVFVFPILIMNWDKRIGGCVNEDEAVGRGKCWIVCFIARLLVMAAGVAVVGMFSQYLIVPPPAVMCQLQFFTTVGAVGFAVIFVIFSIVIPILFYVCLFYITPRCCR